MAREPEPSLQLSILCTKALAHRLFRLCMLAGTDRGHAIAAALDRMIAGTDTPPIVRAGRSYQEPKEVKISLRVFKAQQLAAIRMAEERDVAAQDIWRAAILLACERLEKRMAGEPVHV